MPTCARKDEASDCIRKCKPTPFKTPAEDKPLKRDEVAEPGLHGELCRVCVGGLSFLVRLTRPGALYAVVVPAGVVPRWTKRDGRALRRPTGYLWCTRHCGCASAVSPADLKGCWRASFWDSDLAGSEGSTRSSAGP